MGNNTSNEQRKAAEHLLWVQAEKQAKINYNYRVRSYNYIKHGDYYLYMQQVEAQYELECMPEYLRRGF